MVEDDVRRLAICSRSVVATRAIEDLGLPAVLLGVVLSQRLRAMARAGLRPDRLTNDALETLLKAHARGRVTREGLAWLIARILQRRPDDTIIDEHVLRFLDEIDMKPATDQDIDAAIERALDTASPQRFATEAKRRRFVMGRLMRELIGRVDGATLFERLDRKLQAVVTA